ncbi:MAG: indolepyruvate ferredoxin oxidoreductase subunit alpha [Desulfobacteraceae bacterium]|jgi:indolepyruvate ferredoxin oxidoreductase alpha subunit|nr:MAG: indolepyruvate ferredoxin oxidoreductase subunit alpha [Desulfobacteraceae bacterium]
MKEIFERSGGSELLLQGNEAIARGALESGVRFCAGYPGNPSSEIIETLAEAAKEIPVYAEWSINEKVALEAAAAASFAGLRAIVSMKQNGVNVVSDFLTNLSLSGTGGGLVLVTCDDPGGISSTNEEDARLFAKLADVPLLEPSTPQEALEMTKWAFELSEQIKNIVILRSVSRLSHTRANTLIGDLPDYGGGAFFDTKSPFHTFPVLTKHLERHKKLDSAMILSERSAFNRYDGPDWPELLVIASGSCWNYVTEAVELLDLSSKVGVLKLGMTWPLPCNLLRKHLARAGRILFAEELDAFVEESVKALTADLGSEVGIKNFYGRGSGHIPICGELSPGLILGVLGDLFSKVWKAEIFREKIRTFIPQPVPPREFGFCAGCPHRGSFYAIKAALAWDGRNGFVSGDIGCYSMGIWPTGFNQVKSVHAMGSGVGLASGYGKLGQFGFDQPVITVCGDSTFFHAAIPALINARFNDSDILLLILDNSATAMTGFQPHPGTGSNAMGHKVEPVDIESVCRSLGVYVEVGDPYDLNVTACAIYRLMGMAGPRVLILRRKCALVQGRQGGFPYTMMVAREKCLGEECGCGRYCTKIFRCPGLIWDAAEKKALIDEVICVGCGICSEACPRGAIVRMEKRKD